MVSALLLLLIYISFISLGLPDSLLGSSWPAMYQGLNVPISYAGIISMIVSGGTIISSFLSDKLIRKFGTGNVTLLSVFMTAAALYGFSSSGHFLLLCLWAIPLGLGAGSVDAALNNYVALHYKALHMSWLHCFWGIGATIGPVIMSVYLTRSGAWQNGYFTISLLQFSLVLILLLSLPLWKKVEGKSAVETQEGEPADTSFGILLRLPGAKSALLSFFCYCSIEQIAGLWGSTYLVTIHAITPEAAARYLSLYYLGITLGRFISGILTVWLNHKQMIRLGQVLMVFGVLLFFLPSGGFLLLAAFLIIGLGCAPIYPCLLHETPLNFGRQYSQALMGIQMAFAYMGSTFMPPLFGFLASLTGYRLFPFFLSALLLLMITMIELLSRQVARHHLHTVNGEDL